MNLIDAHHHLWIPQQSDPDIGYGWLRDIGAIKPFGDPTSIQRDYELNEFLSESAEHEIVGSVFLQTDGALPDSVKETEWVAGVLSQSQRSHAIVSFVDLDSHSAETDVERHLQCGLLRGVRQIVARLDDQPALCFAPKHYLRSPTWIDNLSVLAKHNLSFDLQLYPEQMLEAAEVFSRWPELSLIVDHTGSPWDSSTSGFNVWKEGVSALAELPNCTIKLSGFGMFDTQWSTTTITPLLEHCVQCFGSSRMMFGSNFPVDKLMAGYDDVVNRIASALLEVSTSDAVLDESVLEDVFCNTAQRVYQLNAKCG